MKAMAGKADQRPAYLYIDILRCTATYLVIALHCIASYFASSSLFGTPVWWVCNVVNSITRMGVPLFFMVSGFLLLSDKRELDIPSFYAKRLKKVLIPFLCWDIIYFLENCYLQAQPLDFRQFLLELLAQRGSKYHLWFIYKIIAIYLLIPFLKKILNHCKLREQILLLLVVMLQPTIFPFINTVQSAVHIDFGSLIEGRIGFFILGYILGTYDFSSLQKRILYLGGIVGFLLNIWGSFYYSSPQEMNLVFNDGCALTHFLTAGAFFLWVKEHCGTTGSNTGVIPRLSRRISELSYGIYLSHVLLLDCFIYYVRGLPNALGASRSILVFFAGTALCSTLLAFLLSKSTRLRKLLVSGF